MADVWYMWLSRKECEELGRTIHPTWEIEIVLPCSTITWSNLVNSVVEANME